MVLCLIKRHKELTTNEIRKGRLIYKNKIEIRLIVGLEYVKKLIFIVWTATHSEHDKIKVEDVKSKKSIKN